MTVPSAAGQDPRTPAALIECGGTPRQRTLLGTLGELVERAAAWSTGGPALVLIGPAVGRALPITSPAFGEAELQRVSLCVSAITRPSFLTEFCPSS